MKSILKQLISKGLDHLDLVKDSQTHAIKLINKRIDLWVEDELSAYYTVKRLGHVSLELLHKTFKLNLKLDGYLAFSLNTKKKLVDEFRETLNELIANGTPEKIKTEYL